MAELPDWQPLEQVSAAASGGTTSGRVVGIVASEGAVGSAWAEHAALTLAKRWSDAGEKVVLVDGSLQHPSLHTAAGVENGEGLSDAALFGASVGRVAKPVEDGAFFLISAGTAVADTNAVVRSGRWDTLARGFVEAGVTLAVFLRDGESGAAAFLGSASEIVVLSGQFDPPPGVVRDLEPMVRLVTGAGKRAPRSASGDNAPLSTAALKETAREGRSRMLVLILLAVVLIVVLAALFGLVALPGMSSSAVGSPPTEGLASLMVSVAG
jgi:hypothetical protein